jgi:medium-chain acyl-[acyl-carrier-protein] hydrolase
MMKAQSTPWVVRARESHAAPLRLFCFPYAGGAANVFHQWSSLLPPSIEVCAVQPPGRGSRLLEEPFTDLVELVRAAAGALLPYMDRPFALFGHSMGALVAFELARLLRREWLRGPLCLFVGGRCAPQIPETRPPLHALPEPQLLKELELMNGTPEEVLAHPDLMKLMLPLLRGDFSVAETYRYTDEPPLDCPITAFGGLGDVGVSRQGLEAWEAQTRVAFSLHMLAGDHFFLHTAERSLLDVVASEMARLAGETMPTPG